MNKRIISKVGKRHKPDIDMMEYIQLDEVREFDLDKYKPTEEELYEAVKKNSVDIEQTAEFGEEIENQE